MAKTPSKPPQKPAASPAKILPPKTNAAAEKLASEAMRAPSTLTSKEIKTLGAEVLRHIEPRKGGKP